MEDFLARATAEDFRPRLGARFSLEGAPGPDLPVGVLTLSEVQTRSDVRPHVRGGRTPFGLIFRGPVVPVLPQATYRLADEQLGVMALFLVPIGRDHDAVRYEAIFT